MQSLQLFPSNVYIDKINDTDWLDQALEYAQVHAELKVDDCSVRHGWQSPKNLHELPLFIGLADKILRKIKRCNIAPAGWTPCVTEMWLNVQEQHGFNHVHVHSGAWYAGVVYVKCTEQSGNLLLSDPRPAAEMSPIYQLTEGHVHTITPSIGKLVLFPGFLPHAANPNCDPELCISIAFNLDIVKND